MTTGSTLHDVAAIAGVSPRTVSRVVNDEGGFGADTRQRVLDAIERVGYRPNMLARALITRRTGTVGLIVPDMTDPFFAELADGVQRAARAHGQTMFIAQNEGEPAIIRNVLDTLASLAVDGVILYTARGDYAAALAHAERGLRVVVVDQEVRGPNLGSIVSDLRHGAELAVAYLAAAGRRRIAMIANADSPRSSIAPRRESGYRNGLHAAGYPFRAELLSAGAPTIDGGRHAVDVLLASGAPFDALFTYNDLMALGALQSLARAGRRVPDDVAVVGFDDIAMCAALVPALTTVRLDRARIGREALAMLGRIAEHPGEEGDTVTIDVDLVRRDSA